MSVSLLFAVVAVLAVPAFSSSGYAIARRQLLDELSGDLVTVDGGKVESITPLNDQGGVTPANENEDHEQENKDHGPEEHDQVDADGGGPQLGAEGVYGEGGEDEAERRSKADQIAREVEEIEREPAESSPEQKAEDEDEQKAEDEKAEEHTPAEEEEEEEEERGGGGLSAAQTAVVRAFSPDSEMRLSLASIATPAPWYMLIATTCGHCRTCEQKASHFRLPQSLRVCVQLLALRSTTA